MQKGNASAYFTLPDPNAPKPPPPPDPNMVLVQGQLQLQNDKQQGELQLKQFEAQANAAQSERDAQHKREQMILHEQLLDQRTREQFAQQQAWEREKFYAELAQKTNAAAMASNTDAATAAAMNNVILRDTEGNQVSMPVDHVATIRQQNIDSAHADADRIHAAQQADLDRQHQAEMVAQSQPPQVQSPS